MATTVIATTLLNDPTPERGRSNRSSGTSGSTAGANISNTGAISEGDVVGNTLSSASPASKLRIMLIIFQLSAINFLSSYANALITIGLPSINKSIDLPRSLYLWPASVYGLTSGSTLLIAGSIADLIGARKVELTGCWLVGVFTLACGFANTGVQLVIFRALQGLAMSLHLPSSVSLVAAAVPAGRSRNIGFACLGLSQPLGFSVGLVLNGVLIEKLGWETGFYLCGAVTLLTAFAGFWALPTVNNKPQLQGKLFRTMWNKIDWIGGGIASAGLAMLSYVLATLSADTASIHQGSIIAQITLSLILILCFPLWMHRQQQAGKPALIPNSLWKKVSFASTCLMVAISYGAVNAMELFSSLYFQEIQSKPPLVASLYLLPNLLVGVCINLSTGLFVDKIPARWLVALSSLLSAGGPMLMAIMDPSWSYWYAELWAQILAPLGVDVLFTVGLIIVSDVFPEETQALAGAVFSTVAQFGMSLGVGSMQVISLGVSGPNESGGHGSEPAEPDMPTLLRGYRASFWAMFGSLVVCGLIAVGGLRNAGKVGMKRD